MKLPEIQSRLWEISKQENLPELAILASHMSRRVSGRGPRSSRQMSPLVVKEIRAARRNNPLASQAQIAELIGVNAGRVSEVLKGKRV